MDGLNRRVFVFLLLVINFSLSACFEQKSASTVMSSNDTFNPQCAGQAIPHEYIVEWENGEYTTVHIKDIDSFQTHFVEPNLDKIKRVVQNRKIILETVKSSGVSTQSNSLDSWGQMMVGADQAWAQNIKGQGVNVAVVDSFVDISHAQLQKQILINEKDPINGIDDDKNGIIDDYYGAAFLPSTDSGIPSEHGTHVAGIIAANPETGPVAGVAPAAKIIPAQFISNNGAGGLDDAIRALNYAAARGAKIINASWGGAPCSATLRDAMAKLEQQGILIVVAAGNSGRDIGNYPEYPASFNLPNQLTVAASTMNDYMASFSNNSFNLVHLAAPGFNIFSTVPNSQTDALSGTSMAAPFVSGAAALLWSVRPNATVEQIKTAILTSVDITTGHEYRVMTRGRLNIPRAIQKIKAL